MAAESEPPLALGKVAAQAGGEGAFCLTRRTTCLSVSRAPKPRRSSERSRRRPDKGRCGKAHPSFEESDRAGVGAGAAAEVDVGLAGLASDGQERRPSGEDFDPAGAVLGLARASGRARRCSGGLNPPANPIARIARSRRPRKLMSNVANMASSSSAKMAAFWRGGRACRRRMPARTVAICRSRISNGTPSPQ